MVKYAKALCQGRIGDLRGLALLCLMLAGIAPVLAAQRPIGMTAQQREAVRAAAAPYRGQRIELIAVPGLRSANRRFLQEFRRGLEAAGLNVVELVLPDGEKGDCASTPGLRAAYSAPLSGAANAIAEALVRSKAVPGSVAGCSIGGEAVLRFILADR